MSTLLTDTQVLELSQEGKEGQEKKIKKRKASKSKPKIKPSKSKESKHHHKHQHQHKKRLKKESKEESKEERQEESKEESKQEESKQEEKQEVNPWMTLLHERDADVAKHQSVLAEESRSMQERVNQQVKKAKERFDFVVQHELDSSARSASSDRSASGTSGDAMKKQLLYSIQQTPAQVFQPLLTATVGNDAKSAKKLTDCFQQLFHFDLLRNPCLDPVHPELVAPLHKAVALYKQLCTFHDQEHAREQAEQKNKV